MKNKNKVYSVWFEGRLYVEAPNATEARGQAYEELKRLQNAEFNITGEEKE